MERELTRVIRRIAQALHKSQFPLYQPLKDEGLKDGGWWDLAVAAYKELLAIDSERMSNVCQDSKNLPEKK